MKQAIADFHSALERRYAIEHELGRGGMATVYLAYDLKGRACRMLPARAEIAIACGKIDEARAAADELAAIASLYQSSALSAAAVLARGMVEVAEGAPAAAAATLRRARTLWTELELPYEAARSRVAGPVSFQSSREA